MATVTHAIAATSTTAGTTYASGSFQPASNDLLLLFVTKSGSVNVGEVFDSFGGSWVFVTSALKAESLDLVLCFLRTTPAGTGATTVTYDCTGDVASGCILQVARISGMSKFGLDAVRQSAKRNNRAAATIPKVTFGSACLTVNPVLALVGNASNPCGVTEPTGGWTLHSDVGYAGPATGAAYASRDSGFKELSVSWGSASATAFAALAIELDIAVPPSTEHVGVGQEKIYDAQFIRDDVTADTVVDYLAKRAKFGQDTCDFELTQEARELIPGDLVLVSYAPCGYADTIVEVRTVKKTRESIHVTVASWSQSIYTYELGTIPPPTPTPPGGIPGPVFIPRPGGGGIPIPPLPGPDGGTDGTGTSSGSLFIPRPGGLEIPGQGLDQEFLGCDIALQWYATSELFVNNQDEENLPGAQIAGYWVTVIVNGIQVRQEFVTVPAYAYPIWKNQADNPPRGARVVTFSVQAKSLTGVLGQANYITVFNLEQDLTPLALGPVSDVLSTGESVTIQFVFATGQVFDTIPVTDAVDVIMGLSGAAGARRVSVRDYTDVWDYVTVQINARFINVTDYIAEYDAVERMESTGRSIFVAEDIQPDDVVDIRSNVIRVFEFNSTPTEKVTITRG